MKNVTLLGAILLIGMVVQAQWLTSGVYNRPLKEVLSEIEIRYGVRIDCGEKRLKDKVVDYAPWKFYNEVEQTLDNVLRPLDMRFARKADGVYEIKNWEYFRKPFDEGQKHLESLLASYPTLADWEARKVRIRENVMEVLGLNGLPKCDLNPVRSNFRKQDGYSVENIALEILPGVWVCGSLYMPLKHKGTIPAFLCPHGHFYNKVDTSIPNERGRYRPDQQLRCAMLAKMGVAVFSYDMFGWGESTLAFQLKDHRTDLGLIMQTWQSIRVLDYLCAQPFVDKGRIGVTAASGGATQAMIITALDERITLSVPTVMMASHFFGGCPCESGLPIHFIPGTLSSNNAEFAAMAAPRPQLVISDGNDWTVTTPEIEYPYLQKIYDFYGCRRLVKNVHLPLDQHDYGYNKRVAMYDFVTEQFHLQNARIRDKKGNYDESRVTIEPATAMLVFGEKGKLPEHAVKDAGKLRELLGRIKD